jgi:Flp pilus assembly protein TadG
MIVLLLIMVGLGLDTGQLTYVRNQGQAAVDAAALAAVSALPSRDDNQVKSRAAGFNSTNDYVESPTNKIGSGNVSYIQYDFTTNTITDYNADVFTANGVRVALEGGSGITTPVFLTPLMNLLGISTGSTKDVNVSAVSVINAKPSIPIALWSSVCDEGTTVPSVKIRQQNPGSENSCWTCYLDNSCGSKDVKALFKDAQECRASSSTAGVDVGTKIYENKGQQASDYGVASDFFFNDYPNREWLIPVINGSGNCNQKNPTPIVDWAKIKVTNIVKNGAHSYIEADVTCKQSLQQAENSICFSHRLIREPNKGY